MRHKNQKQEEIDLNDHIKIKILYHKKYNKWKGM